MQLLSRIEAASLLGISNRTLEKWAVTGEGPAFIKVGGLVRYERTDIESWLLERRVENTTQCVRHVR